MRGRLSRLLTLFTVALAGASTDAFAQTRVVVGTAGGYGDSSVAVRLALDKGYYKQVGIALEVVDFKGGAPAVQALVGGGVQYAIVAPEHVIRLRNRGIDGTVAVALDTHHTYVLVAKTASPLKSFADLKGRRVGITSSGSLTESLLKLQAKRDGLNVGTDFEIVGAGVGAAMKAAIDTGRIEAGMFGNLDAELLLLQGYKIVFDWRPQAIPNLALISTATWQAANPKIARDFAAATLKAQREITSDRETAIEYLRKTYPTLDDRVLQKDAADLATRLSRDGIYDEASIARLQDDLQQIEPTLKRIDYPDVMPLTYLK